MLKLLSHIFFAFTGWKVSGGYPANLPKSVMIAAPHTSNWDLVYARAAFFIMDVPVRFTVKKEAMRFPLGLLLKWMGAIPIDRQRKNKSLGKKSSVVDAMINLYKEREKLVVLITPEGTRSYVPKWKTGFYHVALGANVPILLGFLDYKKKIAGIGPAVYPTGNVEEDMNKILDFYREVTAKYPENGVR